MSSAALCYYHRLSFRSRFACFLILFGLCLANNVVCVSPSASATTKLIFVSGARKKEKRDRRVALFFHISLVIFAPLALCPDASFHDRKRNQRGAGGETDIDGRRTALGPRHVPVQLRAGAGPPVQVGFCGQCRRGHDPGRFEANPGLKKTHPPANEHHLVDKVVYVVVQNAAVTQ